jgi:hypothetical protein
LSTFTDSDLRNFHPKKPPYRPAKLQSRHGEQWRLLVDSTAWRDRRRKRKSGRPKAHRRPMS